MAQLAITWQNRCSGRVCRPGGLIAIVMHCMHDSDRGHNGRMTATVAPVPAEQARALLKALADPLRLQVIEALGQGERCVCELTGELGLAQSKLSFHLKVLREAGLIEGRQQGRWMYYQLRPDAIRALQQWLGELASSCQTPAQPCC